MSPLQLPDGVEPRTILALLEQVYAQRYTGPLSLTLHLKDGVPRTAEVTVQTAVTIRVPLVAPGLATR